jgi:hypothetical protein
LNALERVLGDETRAVAGLGAPSDHLAFGVGYRRIGLGRRPETEVCIYD